MIFWDPVRSGIWNKVSSVLRRFAGNLQVDRSLLYALSARIWQAMAGPITMVFIIRSLTLDEQGVYYTLSTLMTIQLFFELGLLNVLISQAGHLISAVRKCCHPSLLLLRIGCHSYASASLLRLLSHYHL